MLYLLTNSNIEVNFTPTLGIYACHSEHNFYRALLKRHLPWRIHKAMKLLLFLDRTQVSTTLSFSRPDTSVNRPIPPTNATALYL